MRPLGQVQNEISFLEDKNKQPPVGNGYFSVFLEWPKTDQTEYNHLLDEIDRIKERGE